MIYCSIDVELGIQVYWATDDNMTLRIFGDYFITRDKIIQNQNNNRVIYDMGTLIYYT